MFDLRVLIILTAMAFPLPKVHKHYTCEYSWGIGGGEAVMAVLRNGTGPGRSGQTGSGLGDKFHWRRMVPLISTCSALSLMVCFISKFENEWHTPKTNEHLYTINVSNLGAVT